MAIHLRKIQPHTSHLSIKTNVPNWLMCPFSSSDKSMKASWWVRSRVERNPAGWLYWCCEDCSSFRFSLSVRRDSREGSNGRGSVPKGQESKITRPEEEEDRTEHFNSIHSAVFYDNMFDSPHYGMVCMFHRL